jgi:integrase
MPAEPQGSIEKLSRSFCVRWRDEQGLRRRKSGFKSASAARIWFRDVELPRMRGENPSVDRGRTFAEHVERFLEAKAASVDPVTVSTLDSRLGYAVAVFGDLPLGELERRAADIAAWSGTLPKRSRYGIVGAFRQACEAAVRWGYMSQNPAKLAGPNPQPKNEEILPFTQAEVDALAVELGPVYSPLVVFAAETGLRPSEWQALEWRDVDTDKRVVRVERTFRSPRKGVKAETKGYAKTDRSVRAVPLSARALAALEATTPSISTRLVFPGARGSNLDLANFRRFHWHPALEAAGIVSYEVGARVWTKDGPGLVEKLRLERLITVRLDRGGHASEYDTNDCRLQHGRTPYDLRHSYATWALGAGLTLFEVARYMGTSGAMIDKTYGHLAEGSASAAAAKLDAYAEAQGAASVPATGRSAHELNTSRAVEVQ